MKTLPPPPQIEPEPEPEQPVTPPVEKDLTLTELLADNRRLLAEKFINENVRANVIDEETLAETSIIHADSENNIDAVTFIYIKKGEENSRTIESATATLYPRVDCDDIADGKTVQTSVTATRETVFEFDAKENFENQKLINAIYAADKNDSSYLKIIKEVDSPDPFYKVFEFAVQTDDSLTIRQISVRRGNGSEQALYDNLQDEYGRAFSTVKKQEIDGIVLNKTPYEYEEKEENPIEPIEPVPAITNAEVIAYLDKHCVDGMLNRFFVAFETDKANISNPVWYLTRDTQGNITGAEYKFNYRRSTTSEYYYYCIAKVEFESAISVQDIKDDKTITANYSRAYSISYNIETQQTRAQLANAICDTVFGKNETATRYIIDGGYGLDTVLGEVHRFTVIEASNEYVQEISINIKNSSNDSQYISRLENEAYYRTYSARQYGFAGKDIKNNTEAFAHDKTTALGGKVTDAQLIKALNDGYRTKAIDRYFINSTYDAQNISNENWYAVKDEYGNLISATFVFNYRIDTRINCCHVYLTFCATPFTYDDYLNAQKADYKAAVINAVSTYRIQNTATDGLHSSLVNAICAKFCPNASQNAKKCFDGIDKSEGTSFGTDKVQTPAHIFYVYILDGNTLTEIRVFIKIADSDSGYIENLNAGLHNTAKIGTYSIVPDGVKLQ